MIGLNKELFCEIKTKKPKLSWHCIPDITGTVMTGNALITVFYLSILKELHVMALMSRNLKIRMLKHLGLLSRLLSALLLPLIVEKNLTEWIWILTSWCCLIILTISWMQIWTDLSDLQALKCVCDHFFFLSAHTGPRLPPHAEPREMNKAPQPITGSPSAPHPAPSPGLSQVDFLGTSFALIFPLIFCT